MSLVY